MKMSNDAVIDGFSSRLAEQLGEVEKDGWESDDNDVSEVIAALVEMAGAMQTGDSEPTEGDDSAPTGFAKMMAELGTEGGGGEGEGGDISDLDLIHTPHMVVDRLLEWADIQPGMLALEPSAGRGDIAHTLEDHTPYVDCYEYMDCRADALFIEGLTVGHEDFLSVEPNPIYDRIVMHPPCSNSQDMKHFAHATQFLAPGGRLVAVMSRQSVLGGTSIAREFQQALIRAGAEVHRLSPDAFDQTGLHVQKYVVVVNAPQSPKRLGAGSES